MSSDPVVALCERLRDPAYALLSPDPETAASALLVAWEALREGASVCLSEWDDRSEASFQACDEIRRIVEDLPGRLHGASLKQ